VHVEKLEDGSTEGRPMSLGIVDAWLDTRTRGLKLVKKTSIPLGVVADGPYGIRVFAARSDDAVHFVVLPPAPDRGKPLGLGKLDRGIIESGGEIGVSQCRHSRITLRALPGAGEHALISFQRPEPEAREPEDAKSSSDAPVETFATLRTRLVQVHLSASRNTKATEPLVSVSFRVDKPKPVG
jgi:hypothetical protein